MESKIVFLCLFLFYFGSANAGCSLHLANDLGINHPLLLSAHEPKWVSLSQSSKGMVNFARDDVVRLACASRDGDTNYFSHIKDSNVITAKCKTGNNFEINKKSFSFDDLQCEHPMEVTEMKTNTPCLGDNTELIKVGFKVNNEFIPTYEVCFDKIEKSTLYTEVKVPAAIDKAIPIIRDQQWTVNKEAFFNDVDINSIYNYETQKATFKRILNKDFFGSNKCGLEKGKLVTNNDVTFMAEQSATANYLNAVPQWSTCNRANWMEIEKRVKNMATSLNHPLTVWTGGYRKLKLAKKWGFTYAEMFLHYIDSTHKGVPVPLYIWKVIFDQQTQKAVAIIQINNPHMTLTDIDNYVLCEDKCHNIGWLNFLERKTILDGYIYCCDLPDFEFGFAFKKSPFPRASGILRDTK